ncbi:hypothetical protein Q8F55_003460 [Vanrija albida]|uniref:DSBA-like thioredoxin domain-containing protein n=1 Tax=Vanrija albida TaxID=181172 RepID=A0ABR3Q4U5_9TREE
MTNATQSLKIDVTSDMLCPFCLLGLKQLELAITRYREQNPQPLDINIRIHPFQLNNMLTDEPESREEWAVRKFGPEQAIALRSCLNDKFATVGLPEIVSGGQLSSSHHAQRITEYAGHIRPEAQLPLVMELCEATHIEGTAPSDKDVLARVSTKHGLFSSEEEAREWLDSNAYDIEVRKAYQNAQKQGITGVPFFVFQDKYAASGAMGVDEFVNIIGEIFKREKDSSPQPLMVVGDQCDIHDQCNSAEFHPERVL